MARPLTSLQERILYSAIEYGKIYWTGRDELACPPGTYRTPGERRAIKSLVDRGYLLPEACGWSITEAGRAAWDDPR
jgi:hypothetical protein